MLPRDQLFEAVRALKPVDENRIFLGSDSVPPRLETFCIYNPTPLALRGIQVVSRRAPLGIYGENLDVFLSTFDKQQLRALAAHGKVVPWLDKLVLDTEDELKFQGHKLGRSVSTLYFRDRFMRRSNNIFSAENANEGILHILFYLGLFLSEKTPRFFGIDNIETSLNPQLCRDLMKTIAGLAKEHDKQALITTHNPAILDGLNLHDDEQRLFVVYRNNLGAHRHQAHRAQTGDGRIQVQALRALDAWTPRWPAEDVLTMRIGIIAEGRGDLAVITNLLRGWLGLDREHVQFLRPEYALDETDLHEMPKEQRSNWLLVKDECIGYTRIREFLDTPLDEERLVVIHIDTAEAELVGFDVVRPVETGQEYAIELRKRVAAKLDAWIGERSTEHLRYAIAGGDRCLDPDD